MGRRARRSRQPDMDCKLFTVLLFSGLTVRAEPPVFEEYFDDSIKYVDISFDAAVRSCLTNGESFSNKVSKAYDKCFGTDYDFDELAENGDGKDRDGDDCQVTVFSSSLEKIQHLVELSLSLN